MDNGRYYDIGDGWLFVVVHDTKSGKARVTAKETKGNYKEGDEMFVELDELKKPGEVNS